MYWVIAKSLADGDGYRIPSLPGAPYAIHYPPLYPLFLSLAWRWTPAFPGNLKTAATLQAALLPVYLALLLFVLRQIGLSWRRTFLIAALTVVTFQLVLLTITLFSELLFGCFLLAAIFAVERSIVVPSRAGIGWALAGGGLAGFAYLTRSAGLPLLAATPVFYFMRKRAPLCGYFLACALPLAVGWHIWAWRHPNLDSAGYSTSYFAEYLRVIRVNGFWSSVYQQTESLSASVAENFFPGILQFLGGLPLHHLIFAAAIAGGIRIGKQRHWPLLVIFSALYLVMIICWWNDGLARLVMPVWPALLAGVSAEACYFASLCQKSMSTSRVEAPRKSIWMQAPTWAVLLAAALLVIRNDRVTWARVANEVTAERDHRLRDLQALSWIKAHAAPDTVVLAWKDSVSFLYTGVPSSHSLFIAVTPQQPGLKALAASFASLPEQYRKGLLLLLRSDLGREFGDRPLAPFIEQAEALPEARLVYESPDSRVYSFALQR